MMRLFLVLLCVAVCEGCSNAVMEDGYGLSIRTEDLGNVEYEFGLVTRPAGSVGVGGEGAQHGFVGFLGLKPYRPMSLNASEGVKAGMNDMGLSCDKQTLKPQTTFSPPGKANDLDAALLCRWALERFASVDDVKVALGTVNVVVAAYDDEFLDGHYARGRALRGHFTIYEGRGTGVTRVFV